MCYSKINSTKRKLGKTPKKLLLLALQKTNMGKTTKTRKPRKNY